MTSRPGPRRYEELVATSLGGAAGKDRGRLLGQALVAPRDTKLRMGLYEEAAQVL